MTIQIVGYSGSKGNIPIYRDVPDASPDVQAKIASGQWQPEQNGAGAVTSYIQRNPDGTVTRFGADGSQTQDSWTPSVGSDGMLGNIGRLGALGIVGAAGAGAMGLGAAGAGGAAASPVYGGAAGGWGSLGAGEAGTAGVMGGTAASGAGAGLTGAAGAGAAGAGAAGGGLFGSGISAGTALTIAAPVLGGIIGANGARSAASQQADSAQRAQDAQLAQYQQSRTDLQPWVQSGSQANNKLSSLMGLDGSDPTAQLQATPGYQFRFNEGQKAVDNGAASRGMSLSGGAMKAIAKYGQDFASNEYQNQFNRLNSMSNTGQSSAAGQASQSQAFGNSTATNYMNQGNATASGTMGGTNALSNALTGAVNGYQNSQMMDLYSQKNKLGQYAG